MPTNYAFGAGRIQNLRPASSGAEIASPTTRLNSTTTDRVNNTTSAPKTTSQGTSTARAPVGAALQSSNPILQNQKIYNQMANNFGQQMTDIKIAEAQRKAAEAAAEAARKAAQQQQGYSYQYNPGTPVDMTQYTGPMTGARAELIQAAQSLLGTPYAWGGGGYGVRSSHGIGMGTENVVGVDCSGLTSYAYSTLGIRIPRTARQQGTIGYRTSVNNLRPGDLVVYSSGTHVMMWLGNGMVIESPKPGGFVRIRALSSSESYYGVHIQLPGE